MLVIKQTGGEDFHKVTTILTKATKVIVLVGAGISTNCGILDFRSKDGLRTKTIRDGLQMFDDLVEVRHDRNNEIAFEPMRENLFEDIPADSLLKTCDNLFDYTPARSPALITAHYRYFALFREVINQNIIAPSPFHMFIPKLKERGMLAHCLTQNIDGLEALSGCTIYKNGDRRFVNARSQLDPSTFDVLQLHGGLNTAWCMKSNHLTTIDAHINGAFLRGEGVECEKCVSTPRDRPSRAAAGAGQLRPGVVLYDEGHPNAEDISGVMREVLKWDFKQGANVLLIAGTSLRAHGAANLVRDIVRMRDGKKGKELLHVIMVDRCMPGVNVSSVIDILVQMDCDEFAVKVWGVGEDKKPVKTEQVDSDEFDSDDGEIMAALLG